MLNDKSNELWDEYSVYLNEFKSIFKQDTRDEAVAKINEIKRKINSYPEFIAEYLKKNFFTYYAQYLVFLKENVKEHLESTNNKIENYIGNILDKSKKNIFRTLHGVFSYIFTEKMAGFVKDWRKKKKKQNKIIISFIYQLKKFLEKIYNLRPNFLTVPS